MNQTINKENKKAKSNKNKMKWVTKCFILIFLCKKKGFAADNI